MKRKDTTPPQKPNPSNQTKKKKTKTNPQAKPCDQKETVSEVVGPWKNLELILSLQSSELSDKEKVELAFSFVEAYAGEKGRDEDEEEECQAVTISRLVMYLSDWIQSLFFSKENNFQVKSEICLDFRCWNILRFCLKQSSILHVSINSSRYLLKAIGFIAGDLLSSGVDLGDGQGFEAFTSVVDCVDLLFSSKSGLFNDSFDLWFSAVEPVLKLTHRVLGENAKDGVADAFVLKFSCLVLEPFSTFMVQPTKKNGFHDFVDKLVEPLLSVLGLLLPNEGKGYGLEMTLLKLIQEILSLGLFHTSHVDGFLGLGGAERYLPESNVNKTVLKSYHRHFFIKFENMLLMKKEVELSCMGSLFSLFINRVMKQQRDSNQLQKGMATKTSPAGQAEVEPGKQHSAATNDNESSAKSHCSSFLRWESRKSLFDFFLHLMEPILLKIDGNVESSSENASLLPDFCCLIKSANSLLVHFARERIYVKTEDASEGACFCFLKKIFTTIVSVASQLQKYHTYSEGSKMHMLLAKELIIAIGYLLQIEYEVIENDLVTLWLIILSFMRFSSLSSENAEEDCPLTSLLLGLGCQLINLYSDLRQVSVAVFAMSKAVRLVIPADGDNGEMVDVRELPLSTVFLIERSAQSVEKLLSCLDLRLAIHRAIKVIPEGQASDFIKSLTTDVSETIDWIRVSCSASAREQDGQAAAFLAGALSAIYSLILDSLTIKTGNSINVGESMNSLVILIRPCLSHLVSSDSDCIENFLSAVTGKGLDIITAEKNRDSYRKSLRFFIIFFLRIYMSSRSLCRQVISLMPPEKSKEMAGIMGDSATARRGSDWVKKKVWNDEGYFSWICQPSASIVDIIKQISAVCLKDDTADCSLLVYILYGVALQRLVDLNRDIKSLDYVSQISDHQMHGTALEHVSVLKCEGEELTDFLLGNTIVPGFAEVETIDNTDQWVLRASGIEGKCLPAVRFWVLSQHIDIWCPHAGKKNMGNFLSQLIGSSVPRILNGVYVSNLGSENSVDEGTQNKKTGLELSSFGLLCDSVLYEHEFVRRSLAPSFSHILKTTAEAFFKDFTEEIDSQPDWSEVLILLENSVANISGKLQSEAFVEVHVSELENQKFTACQNLLNLLCVMPKEYMNKKSLQLYASFILDLERSLVFTMSRCLNKPSPGDMQNLFSLFITCRKTLKSIAMVSCDKVLRSTTLPLSDISLLTSWLFKSVQAVVTCQERVTSDFTRKSRDALFALMDHTSYMFLTVSRDQFSKALPLFDGQLISTELSEGSGQAHLTFESLTQQAETLLNSLRATFRDQNTVFECKTLILNKLVPVFSSLSGLLWGVASSVSHREMQKSHKNAKLRWKSEEFSKLSGIIRVLSNFLEVFAQYMFLSGDVQREIRTSLNWTALLDGSEGSNGLASGDILETSSGVKKQIIESLIKGDSTEVVLALRHLLIASAAILNLNLQVKGITFSPSFVPVLTGISFDLLSVLAGMSELPLEFSFIWLDGAAKYLEELGSHLCLFKRMLNRDHLYSKSIELHLKVIGKCISLQGKEATLESHETGFGTNEIHAKRVQSERSRSQRLHWLGELKDRFRMSFKVLIHNSEESHLKSGLEAIEIALVGVSEVCPAIYSIQTGDRDGGRISETAAAGIDCLDLVLEHATGSNRLNVVKDRIQGLMSAVFGIMAHMQSPFIFCTDAVVGNQGPKSPDAGSVILMCVEVLIRIAGKHALFKLNPSHTFFPKKKRNPSHISQSIHMTGAIFRDYLQITKVGFSDLLGSSKDLQVDQKFSVSLYSACCRLIYTTVKHHPKTASDSIATLLESVSALLHCLETAGNKVGKCDSFEVEEGITCACFLRRIYEELREQKEVFGHHCFKFLSTYIWVSCGFGPLKTGFKREVDEALRPGVYALIDSCSDNDRQYLHTVFGEGPCRNYLAALKEDHKLNFKYHGKV